METTENKFGTDQIKKVIDVIAGIGNDTGVALEDGKFEPIEALAYTKTLLLVPNVFKSFSQLKEEIKDVNSQERDELVSYIQVKFDIPQENLEAVAEKILEMVFKVVELIVNGFELRDLLKSLKA